MLQFRCAHLTCLHVYKKLTEWDRETLQAAIDSFDGFECAICHDSRHIVMWRDGQLTTPQEELEKLNQEGGKLNHGRY